MCNGHWSEGLHAYRLQRLQNYDTLAAVEFRLHLTSPTDPAFPGCSSPAGPLGPFGVLIDIWEVGWLKVAWHMLLYLFQ